MYYSEDACFNACLIAKKRKKPNHKSKAFLLLIFMSPVSREKLIIRAGHSETDVKVANSF